MNMKSLSTFVITVALIAGTVGCVQPVPFCDITFASTAGGSVTAPGEGTFRYAGGTAVNLVAKAEEGYQFVKWTGDCVCTIGDVNDASTTITVNDNYEITANFELKEGWYSLTISSTEGGELISPGEGTFFYSGGRVVPLVAEPSTHCRFVEWTGDVGTIASVDAASTTITMNANYTITANFEEILLVQYDLTISSTPGGSVTAPGEGTSTYDEGTVVNLVASPTSGCRFVNWTGDVSTIANVYAASTTIAMNGNYHITANFVTGCVCGG
jgi:uncharacterized repeat protein (TIGR02543 family)